MRRVCFFYPKLKHIHIHGADNIADSLLLIEHEASENVDIGNVRNLTLNGRHQTHRQYIDIRHRQRVNRFYKFGVLRCFWHVANRYFVLDAVHLSHSDITTDDSWTVFAFLLLPGPMVNLILFSFSINQLSVWNIYWYNDSRVHNPTNHPSKQINLYRLF